MFPPKHVFAFIARIVIFVQLILIYPLLYHIMRVQISSLFLKTENLGKTQILWLNLGLIGFNTLLGALYPQVGSIIGLLGGILGLNLMYIIPIALYLKRYMLEISNPELVEALDCNRIKTASRFKSQGNFLFCNFIDKQSTVSPQILVFSPSKSRRSEISEEPQTSIKDKINIFKSKIQERRLKQRRGQKTPLFGNNANRYQNEDTGLQLNDSPVESAHAGSKEYLKFYFICILHFALVLIGVIVMILQFIKI